MRITEHPVLDFRRGEKVTFFYNGKAVEGYESETVAAALHAAGVRALSHSHELGRPRGIFCAIGNCSASRTCASASQRCAAVCASRSSKAGG